MGKISRELAFGEAGEKCWAWHADIQEMEGDERAELPKEGFGEDLQLGVQLLFPTEGCVLVVLSCTLFPAPASLCRGCPEPVMCLG